MTRLNFCIFLIAAVLYIFCSGITMRDRVLINALHRIENDSLVRPTAKQLFEGAMTGMIQELNHSLGDPFSAYIPFSEQKEYEENLDNRYDGIGIVYRETPIDKEMEIIYPILDSPAHKAGIRSGDKLLRVNGKETKGLTFYEVSDLFKSDPKQKIELAILPYDKTEPVEFSVSSAPIFRDSVEGDGIDAGGRRIFCLSDNPEIAYLRITSFGHRTAMEVHTALKQISEDNARSLILDLRNNPGGYVDICVEIAGLFLQPTPEHDIIVSTRLGDGTVKMIYRLGQQTQICHLPMVVLIDGESASAAEILSAALQDYGRATIVGSRSFGKGTVQEIVPLPLNSGTLQLTDASYWRPSNKNIHRVQDAQESDSWGVIPDAEGLVTLSGVQRYATFQIRERRSNYVSENSERLLEQFFRCLPDEVREIQTSQKKMEKTPDETKSEDEPFTLQGKPPYYDPQLDKAIEILKR
ncbi:MAG: S41 family peptidase [Planctomycetaceae bacterium]|jgi:carboxyl-terminal processing protease|nr:S41 family peptidase [Planctomycetaceae bacterium]